MAVVFINYDEPKSETYKVVGISMNDKGKDGRTEIEFKSGDFVKDWYDCTKHIIENVVDTEPVLHSSSVDHFIMDGAKFDSLWLVNVEKEKWDLIKYKDIPDGKQGIEFFVEKGTKPSWSELRKICGD